jgi:hypothetical protein
VVAVAAAPVAEPAPAPITEQNVGRLLIRWARLAAPTG